MLIGYARISTGKQDLALQLDGLERAGCERTFHDTASGALKSRPELEACLDHLRAWDTLVVWRLERLGGSLRSETNDRRAPGPRRRVQVSDRGGRHTTTAGCMAFHIFEVLTELSAASCRSAPTPTRRPPKPSGVTRPAEQHQLLAAAAAMRQQNRPMHAIATTREVSRATLYPNLADQKLHDPAV